jgi:leucyl-tRNA synthetase
VAASKTIAVMSVTILVLRDPGSPEVHLRCEALGAFHYRVQVAEGRSAALISGAAEPGSALSKLGASATLVQVGDEVLYAPTSPARDRVAAGEDGPWPKSVASRQLKRVRSSRGAIFDFPLEHPADRSDPDHHRYQTGAISAFITDWTGMPGACALAVHPAHPLSPGLAPGQQAAFTGRHCRHPLTGDLLPIWVADWVKPEFGTGVVAVNPGHNRMDLAFSRQVGLPVRFALAPAGFDGSPATWLDPPFIRSGLAVRSGSADGLAYDQAGEAYLGTLAERGLAEPCIDFGLGTFRVARAEPDGPVKLGWDPGRRTVATDPTDDRLRLSPSSVLGAVEEPVREADLTVVAPSTLVETDLLAVRLLLAEPDIEPPVKRVPGVVVVGNVVPTTHEIHEVGFDVLRLALLVNGAALDTVSLKPQQVEPCRRFFEVHAELVGTARPEGRDASPEVDKAAGRVKDLLVRGDLKQAFTQLYRLQKGLAKSGSPGEQDFLRYLALAYVLAGVDSPHSLDLAAMWRQL